MQFPRVIRLDDSDERVYERSAHPGEWAVPGSFVFVLTDAERLEGKARQAFRHGFLGIETLGWSTLVSVEEITALEYAQLIERLATHLRERYGAPDMDAARAAAIEELEYAASLCESRPVHTLLALERELGADGISESLRVVQPPTGLDHERVRIWAVEDD
jgi:hypothetical protein